MLTVSILFFGTASLTSLRAGHPGTSQPVTIVLTCNNTDLELTQSCLIQSCLRQFCHSQIQFIDALVGFVRPHCNFLPGSCKGQAQHQQMVHLTLLCHNFTNSNNIHVSHQVMSSLTFAPVVPACTGQSAASEQSRRGEVPDDSGASAPFHRHAHCE